MMMIPCPFSAIPPALQSSVANGQLGSNDPKKRHLGYRGVQDGPHRCLIRAWRKGWVFIQLDYSRTESTTTQELLCVWYNCFDGNSWDWRRLKMACMSVLGAHRNIRGVEWLAGVFTYPDPHQRPLLATLVLIPASLAGGSSWDQPVWCHQHELSSQKGVNRGWRGSFPWQPHKRQRLCAHLSGCTGSVTCVYTCLRYSSIATGQGPVEDPQGQAAFGGSQHGCYGSPWRWPSNGSNRGSAVMYSPDNCPMFVLLSGHLSG